MVVVGEEVDRLRSAPQDVICGVLPAALQDRIFESGLRTDLEPVRHLATLNVSIDIISSKSHLAIYCTSDRRPLSTTCGSHGS